jgi:hypothetical protein
MTNSMKILTYMTPREIGNGYGFTSIISPEEGVYLLVSEIHHGSGISRYDETLVFPCLDTGETICLDELHSGRDTADAIRSVEKWWDRGEYDRLVESRL